MHINTTTNVHCMRRVLSVSCSALNADTGPGVECLDIASITFFMSVEQLQQVADAVTARLAEIAAEQQQVVA